MIVGLVGRRENHSLGLGEAGAEAALTEHLNSVTLGKVDIDYHEVWRLIALTLFQEVDRGLAVFDHPDLDARVLLADCAPKKHHIRRIVFNDQEATLRSHSFALIMKGADSC